MNIGILSPFNPAEFKDYLPGYVLPSICKSASSVNALVLGLLQKGIKVHVFTCASVSSCEFFGKQLSVTVINNRYPIIGTSRNNRLLLHNRIIRAVKQYIKDIDIIHAQWTYEYALAASYYSSHIPVFCTVRDWCPFIISCQHKITDKFFWSVISNNIFQRVFADTNIHFIANSMYTCEKIKSKYPNLEIEIVPNSIKNEYIYEGKHIRNKNVVFITISQSINEPRKNIDRLVRAFSEYIKMDPLAKMIMVGKDCVYDNDKVKYWESKGLLKNVDLRGYVEHDELISILDKCDVLVHPSIEETFGNILLEGMARKLLVIGGEKAGAVPYVLEGGEAGILCDVTDESSILNALKLSSNKDLIEAKVSYASQIVREKYSADSVSKKQILIYKKYFDGGKR